jgi:hypothetical protein
MKMKGKDAVNEAERYSVQRPNVEEMANREKIRRKLQTKDDTVQNREASAM